MILSQFGADVIIVDKTGGQIEDPAGLGIGKRSISLNLKSPKGKEVLMKMIEKADVLLEPFRPGVLESLGFAPDILLKKNPRLVIARLTGWGQTGSYAPAAGHDMK